MFKLMITLDSLEKNGVIKGIKVSEIARIFGYSVKTTYIYLQKLAKLGFIKKEQVKLGSKKGESQIIIKIIT